MRKSVKISSFIVCALAVVLTVYGYMLFHGYYDHAQFAIEQVELSSSRQLAMVGRRSDHEALDGDQYFVVIGDHPFSPTELRHAYYYGRGMVFRAGSNCLRVHWKDPGKLVVSCADHSIRAGAIAEQRDQVGNVSVAYEDIPHISRKN